MGKYTKYKKILIAVLVINVILVATHEGEFWPFSIFPMFSQAGNPWTRAMVQQVDDRQMEDLWSVRPLHEVSDRAVAIEDYGVDQIDYSNFISKTTDWNQKRIQSLRTYLDIDNLPEQKWLITKVDGYLTEADSVIVEATPLFLFTSDSTFKNPNIFEQSNQ